MFIGFDTETFLIERALLAPPMVCCQYKIPKQDPSLVHAKQARDHLFYLLYCDVPLVGHNIAYDMAVICETYPDLSSLVWEKYERGEVLDTMIAEMLIDIARGTYSINSKKPGWYTLEQTASRYGFEKAGDDPWRLRYGELYDLPVSEWPSEAVEYALHDAVVPVQVFESQLKHIEWLGDLENQCRAAFCLHLMSCWGVHTDRVKVEALRQDVDKLLDDVRGRLVQAGLLSPKSKKDNTLKRNTRIAQQLQWNEARRLGIDPKWTKGGLKKDTKDRQIKDLSLDGDAIETIGLPILTDYSIWVTQNTLKARVEDLTYGYDLPLQARFEVLKNSGRTSSKKPSGTIKGTQLQNVPTKLSVRECFIPRDGMCFIGADLSMAELHTLSQAMIKLFGKSRMADALNAGQDIHVQFAARILNTSYNDAYTRYCAGDEEIEITRNDESKQCNFGLGGGMGWARLIGHIRQATNGRRVLDEQRSKYLIRLWKDEWDMWPFFQHVNALLGGRKETSYRTWSSDRYRGRVTYCELCNSFFQPPAADGLKRAMWLVSRACYNDPGSSLFGFRPWNSVHDESLLEGPIERAHEAALELKRLMELGFNTIVPDVPTTAEPVAMMYWSKKAKAIYDEKGRLVPWQ